MAYWLRNQYFGRSKKKKYIKEKNIELKRSIVREDREFLLIEILLLYGGEVHDLYKNALTGQRHEKSMAMYHTV